MTPTSASHMHEHTSLSHQTTGTTLACCCTSGRDSSGAHARSSKHSMIHRSSNQDLTHVDRLPLRSYVQ